MPEELPPASSDADDASKAETIRITLPPKQETAAVKRETVRINLPGRPAATSGGTTPKKETTKLPSGLGAAPAAPSAPVVPPPSAPSAPSAPSVPGLSKPSGAPPPPKPLMTPAPGAPALTPAPPALGKPLAGTNPAPKPPSLGGNRPTMPLKPAPSAAPGLPSMPTPAPSPMVQKAASPKKETARITLPPEGTAKPALPKATVKMGQTQPLVNRPAASASALTVAKTAPAPVVAAGEAIPAWIGIAALIVSIASFVMVIMSFQGAGSLLGN